ncbi:MAG: T9SS type A sorting domain-containing protein, partial [Chitinophagales bacterium]
INVLDSTSYFDSIRNINVYDKYFYSKRKWINDSIDKIDTVVSKNTINNLSLQLMLHPNPASDYVEVVSQKWTVGSVVEMYNLLGQQVFPSIEMSNDGLRLDVRDLSEGIYLLQMRDKSGSVIKTEKLVISR